MLLILLFLLFSDLYNSLSLSSSTVTTRVAFSLWVRPDDPAVPYSSYFLWVLDLLPVDLFDTSGLLFDYQNLLTNPPVLSPFIFLFCLILCIPTNNFFFFVLHPNLLKLIVY